MNVALWLKVNQICSLACMLVSWVTGCLRQVVFVGDHSAGKTCLVQNFGNGMFSELYVPTVGVDYGYHLVHLENGQKVDVTFWDLAGGEEFYLVRKHLYQDAAVVCIVCDGSASVAAAEATVRAWREEVRAHGPASALTAVLVNKADLRDFTPSSKTIKGCQLRQYQVSAKTGEGVKESVTDLIGQAFRAAKERMGKTNC